MAEEERPLESTTRSFKTTKGIVSYAELSDLIAPHLLALFDDISDGKYRERELNEFMIQDFHRRITGEIIPNIAGKWRTIPVRVGNHIPPEPYEVPVLMHEYAENLNARIKNANTLELQIEALAYAEGAFLHIHPFEDFNGRTVRALLLELLLRFNLPPIDTAVARETVAFKDYQDCLADYDNGRPSPLQRFWEERFKSDLS